MQSTRCPPASSGGTHLIEILNILENFDMAGMEINSPEYIHHFSEAFKMAFADRAKYMADTAFASVPLKGLTSKDYAAKLAGKITDVSGSYWAADYIDEAAANGWIVGYGNGTFGPDKSITRAEVVTIVNRVLDREADKDYIAANAGSVKTFPDVPSSHWAYYAVLEAANAHKSPIKEGAESWLGK